MKRTKKIKPGRSLEGDLNRNIVLAGGVRQMNPENRGHEGGGGGGEISGGVGERTGFRTSWSVA